MLRLVKQLSMHLLHPGFLPVLNSRQLPGKHRLVVEGKLLKLFKLLG